MDTPLTSIPGVSAPLRRALHEEGFETLESLDGVPYDKLIALHGVGKAGLKRLHDALSEKGLGLTGFPSAPPPSERSGLTCSASSPSSAGHAVKSGVVGSKKNDNQTVPIHVDPRSFLDSLPSTTRRDQGKALLEIFRAATGAEPVMWGPSMIGYGEYHYRYDSGREGDTFKVGFSPRSSAISLYGLQTSDKAPELFDRLGKHKRAVGCIYVNKLSDIDLEVLSSLIVEGWAFHCE